MKTKSLVKLLILLVLTLTVAAPQVHAAVTGVSAELTECGMTVVIDR